MDLGITPEFLGLREQEFESLTSRTGRDQALADMQIRCGEVLEKDITPRLEKSIRAALGKPQSCDRWLDYEFDNRVHSPIVHFRYPTAFPEGLADDFPMVFTDWACEVTALELACTFWEKATILHAEHHRPEGRDMPVRHARHFSDFANLLVHEDAEIYLADQAMCRRVADWKDRVFARKWARHDLARHGTFRLVPPSARLNALEKDYAAMRPMFLSEPLPFDELLHRLQDAEQRMNAP